MEASLIPPSPEWYLKVQEPVIDPTRPIVDSHHHLWREDEFGYDYLLPDLHNDTNSGHNIVKTVFVNCRTNYWDSGPNHLRPVGETEFIANISKTQNHTSGAKISAIIGHADLALGAAVEEVLEAHESAGHGLFRGIRHSLAYSPGKGFLMFPGRAPAELSRNKDFRNGVRRLGECHYIYETYHFYDQNNEFLELAKYAPETTMVLNHLGTPWGTDNFRYLRDEIFSIWRSDITALSECPNVYIKLGGLAMPDAGFNWHIRSKPATSDEIVKAHQRYYLHAIEAFGPDRCMFESNFPVDKLSVSYSVLINAFKKMILDLSDIDKDALFFNTASYVYGI